MRVTSEEGLWVEKSRQPDNTRQRQVLSPAVELFTTLQYIIIPDTHTKRERYIYTHIYFLQLLPMDASICNV